MAFTDRKKQPQLWRAGGNPYPTATEIVSSVLSGIVINVAEKAIAKAFSKLGVARPKKTRKPAKASA